MDTEFLRSLFFIES